MSGADVARVLPELLLAAGAVLGLALGPWLPQHRQALVRGVGLVAAGTAGAAALLAPGGRAFGTSWTVDAVTTTGRLVVLGTVAVVLVLAGDARSWGGHPRETEFAVLVQLGGVGTMVLAGASDLLLLAAAALLTSAPAAAVAGLRRDGRGAEAALKYVLSAAFAGLVLLLGIAVLLGLGRSTAYPVLATTLPAAPAAAVGAAAVAVLGGLAFPIGAVPVHFWVPDVTDGTPPATGAALTTISKVGGLLALWRVLTEVVPTASGWPFVVAAVAVASMTLGNLAAFAQTSLRRLLAYSTVSQAGYLLVPVAVGARTPLALPALLGYVAAYAVTNLVAFAVLAARPDALELTAQRGLVRRRPGLAVALAVALLGLAGLPPTLVFAGKLAAFTAAVDGGMAWLAAVAVLNSAASVFYYLRWIAPVVATDGSAPPEPAARRGPRAGVLAVGLAVVSVAGLAALPLVGA